jgi:hypothetical protein
METLNVEGEAATRLALWTAAHTIISRPPSRQLFSAAKRFLIRPNAAPAGNEEKRPAMGSFKGTVSEFNSYLRASKK